MSVTTKYESDLLRSQTRLSVILSFIVFACLEEETMSVGIINGARYLHRPGFCLEQVNYTSKLNGGI